MTRILHAALLAGICFLAPAPAVAQTKCPEGRTAAGACVNPALAALMRQTAIIFSQPKISQTAYPVLPTEDRRYRYPNQLIPDRLKPAPTAGPSFL
jgi:hypothetical protein